MRTIPPDFRKDARLTLAQRISELSVVKDIDEMLLEDMSAGDVARFIHLGLEELTDVSTNVLVNALDKRRRALMVSAADSDECDDERLAATIPKGGRRVAVLSRSQYKATRKAMDRLIELEALYLAQRDRLDTIIMKEQELGFPFEMTDRTVLAAAKLLELHGKQEKDLLERLGVGAEHENLDIKGYSEETVEVLQKPDSRRRVISIVERLKRIKGHTELPELKVSGE